MKRSIAALAGTLGVMASAVAMAENYSEPGPFSYSNNLLAENVVVADAGLIVAPSVSLKQKYDAAFSVCHAAVPTTHRDFSNANQLAPLSVIDTYLYYEKGIPYDSNRPVQVTLIEKPAHGTVVPDTDFPDTAFVYRPDVGYLGTDQVTFVVETMEKKFKVIETVWVENTAPDNGCPTDIKLPPATTGNDKRGGTIGDRPRFQITNG